VSEQDSTVKRTMLIIGISLVVFMLISVTIANLLARADKHANPEKDARVQAEIEANIKPVGEVSVGAAPVAAPTAAAADPVTTFQSVCIACHGTGVMGAPKLGDKVAWKPRIAKGKATLYKHAIHGFNNMPAKGGRGDLSDETIHAVVDYMVSKGK